MLKSKILSDTMINQQIEHERESIQQGANRYKDEVARAVKRGEGGGLPPAQRLMTFWHPLVVEVLRGELRSIRKGKPARSRGIYGYWLTQLDPTVLAQIAIYEMITLCMHEPAGVFQTKMVYEIGNHVLAEIQIGLLRREKMVKQYRDGKKYLRTLRRDRMQVRL